MRSRTTFLLASLTCRRLPVVIILLLEVLVEKLVLRGVKTLVALPAEVTLVQIVADDGRHRRFLANRFSVGPLPMYTLPACVALPGAPGPARHAPLDGSAAEWANLNFWHDEGVHRILRVHRVLGDEHVRPRVLRWHVAPFGHSVGRSSLGCMRRRWLAEPAAVR